MNITIQYFRTSTIFFLLYTIVDASELDSDIIAERKEIHLKKIAVFNYGTPYLTTPLSHDILEQRIDNEEILLAVLFTRYYQFWVILSLHTCSLYYSREGPYPNNERVNACKKVGTFVNDHLLASRGYYFHFARTIIDKEIGTTFSLRQISSRLQLLEGYANKMYKIFKNVSTERVFEQMARVTKNLDAKDGRTIRLDRIRNFTTQEIADEYYIEVWRRMMRFYGDNLLRLESYFNSVLVDDKDVIIKDLIPPVKDYIGFWENVQLVFAREDVLGEPAEKTRLVLRIVEIHEQYRTRLQNVQILPEIAEEIKYYLEMQPSGVSEYVYVLRETLDDEIENQNSVESFSASSSFSERTPNLSDYNEEIVEISEY